MQKIAIIGPGSIGIAAQITKLCSEMYPECEVISLGDAEVVAYVAPEPRLHDYGPILMSHNFELDYTPTQEEAEWLLGNISHGFDWAVEPYQVPVVFQPNWGDIPIKRWPKHRSVFTKSQPTRQARKAARRRAKAGRRASR